MTASDAHVPATDEPLIVVAFPPTSAPVITVKAWSVAASTVEFIDGHMGFFCRVDGHSLSHFMPFDFEGRIWLRGDDDDDDDDDETRRALLAAYALNSDASSAVFIPVLPLVPLASVLR